VNLQKQLARLLAMIKLFKREKYQKQHQQLKLRRLKTRLVIVKKWRSAHEAAMFLYHLSHLSF
jgi:hypothetical protein